MPEQHEEIVDLTDYRKRRTEKKPPKEDHYDPQQLIADLAYHLLKAIQAVKKLPH